MRDPLVRKAFDWGAFPYDLLTGQPIWREHCERLTDAFPRARGLLVVDLGCGPGVSAFTIARVRPDVQVVGVDGAKGMLRRARGKSGKSGAPGRISWLCSDAGRLPFASGSVDVIAAHSFLYLVDDPDALLVEAARVIKPGGRCVFFEPSDKADLRAIRPALTSPRFALSMLGWRLMSRINGRFTTETLSRVFERAGFCVLSVEKTLFGLGLTIAAEKR